MRICVCMYTHTHTHTHTYVYKYGCAHTYTLTQTHKHTHTSTHTHNPPPKKKKTHTHTHDLPENAQGITRRLEPSITLTIVNTLFRAWRLFLFLFFQLLLLVDVGQHHVDYCKHPVSRVAFIFIFIFFSCCCWLM
jgi:hypothetical protein